MTTDEIMALARNMRWFAGVLHGEEDLRAAVEQIVRIKGEWKDEAFRWKGIAERAERELAACIQSKMRASPRADLLDEARAERDEARALLREAKLCFEDRGESTVRMMIARIDAALKDSNAAPVAAPAPDDARDAARLPDETIDGIAQKCWPRNEWIGVQYIQFARAVERAVIAAMKDQP